MIWQQAKKSFLLRGYRRWKDIPFQLCCKGIIRKRIFCNILYSFPIIWYIEQRCVFKGCRRHRCTPKYFRLWFADYWRFGNRIFQFIYIITVIPVRKWTYPSSEIYHHFNKLEHEQYGRALLWTNIVKNLQQLLHHQIIWWWYTHQKKTDAITQFILFFLRRTSCQTMKEF